MVKKKLKRVRLSFTEQDFITKLSLLQAYYETMLDDIERMEDICKESTNSDAQIKGEIAVLREKVSGIKLQIRGMVRTIKEIKEEIEEIKTEMKSYPEIQDSYFSFKSNIIKFVVVAMVTAVLTALAYWGITSL